VATPHGIEDDIHKLGRSPSILQTTFFGKVALKWYWSATVDCHAPMRDGSQYRSASSGMAPSCALAYTSYTATGDMVPILWSTLVWPSKKTCRN